YAVFYVKDIDARKRDQYNLISTFALKDEQAVKKTIQLGEGLIGQAIVEKKPLFLQGVPSDYIRISSGLGETTPVEVMIIPILFEGEVNAVLEMASLKQLSASHHSFIEELVSNLGIVLESVIGRIQLAHLLEESQTLMEEVQAQSEELQNQQEELRATNEELEEQTQSLRQSEMKLQMQQEELEQTNTELEEKAKSLEKQNLKYEEANRIVEQARKELEVKAEQLALSSKYKSEFLANMSHELRTPLNSLIILSKLLADNPNANLSQKQVEYAKTIYSSGNDLLILINNILDLAKIESGKSEIIPGEVLIGDLVEFVRNNFNAIADNQNISFHVEVQENILPVIYSDQLRIQQVLKNLLSNAFKFTEKGKVSLEISVDASLTKSRRPIFAFSVVDTGIGISQDKLNIIFEAFQQADGTTSRKYGGTGLGLSISREIANLLGGQIEVESEEGKGSKFTFYVGDYEEPQADHLLSGPMEVASTTLTLEEEMIDPPHVDLTKNQSSLPSAPTETSHIKRLLIVDDDLNQRNSLMELVGNMDFIIKAVSTGTEAIETLKVETIDCIILDLGLIDTNGFDLISQIKNNDANQHIKVFVYTGRDLTLKEEIELNKFAHTIIIKNEHSPERLVAELEDYLGDSNEQPETSDNVMQQVQSNQGLLGKKILLVDDDIRNVFALSSVLEMAGMNVVFAENGYESLAMLEQNPDVDLVLMDIMMPEMDGYEAIIKIRENPLYVKLPLIALTAKAMKEDREKCLEIGASDYIAKPVEPDQLISLIKVWLY
ncbi:MAG TPA: response regulator, partial [Ureibacillus sp.]|nr:response regulator [Ureibacillus sp.]